MTSDNQAEFNGSAGKPSSRVQISELEKSRFYPVRQMHLTPIGKQWSSCLNIRDVQKNMAIDEKKNAMKKRLNRRSGQAKEAMNKAKDRRTGKERRGRGR